MTYINDEIINMEKNIFADADGPLEKKILCW